MANHVQFTLRQMRETVGLSLETYRHWKHVLPPLATKGGRTPCFKFGELMAASIIHRLTETAGVRVSFLKDVSVDIFNLCNTSSWTALEGATLAIDLKLRTCEFKRTQSSSTNSELVLLCRIDPVLSKLRGLLLHNQTGGDQAKLRFLPTEVRPSAERRRKRA